MGKAKIIGWVLLPIAAATAVGGVAMGASVSRFETQVGGQSAGAASESAKHLGGEVNTGRQAAAQLWAGTDPAGAPAAPGGAAPGVATGKAG